MKRSLLVFTGLLLGSMMQLQAQDFHLAQYDDF
jgi:hypothetical protein